MYNYNLLPEKIKLKIQITSFCWLWLGHLDKNGYGKLGVRLAHRVVYEKLTGIKLPKGSKKLTCDHTCKVRNCVNPSHIELISLKENILRGATFQGINSRKTHCKRGHEFTIENTVIALNKKQNTKYRACRECRRILSDKWRLSDKGQEYYKNYRIEHKR